MRNRFTHLFSELPDVLPVFPLPGAVILPNGVLTSCEMLTQHILTRELRETPTP